MTTSIKARICDISPSQSGILFDSIYRPESSNYFVQIAYLIRGPLDVRQWKSAWEDVISKNESLRACFVWENLNEPRQVIKEKAYPLWRDENWSHLSGHKSRIERLCVKEQEEGFDLTQPPLMRFNLVEISSTEHYFVWNVHHLIVDGWSLSLILEDVYQTYTSLIKGEPPFPCERPTYRAFLNWINSKEPEIALEYWDNLLKGCEFSCLPTESNGKKVEHKFTFSELESEKLMSIAKKMGVTLNCILQLAWGIILGKKNNSKDVVFGTVASGRQISLSGVERIIGLFVTTFPVRVTLDPGRSLRAAAKSIQSQLAHSQDNAYVSLSEIQAAQKRGGGSLFNTLFIFENYPLGGESVHDHNLDISVVSNYEETEYPLTVTVIPGSKIQIRFSYDKSSYCAAEIEQFALQFETLLHELNRGVDDAVGSLSVSNFSSGAAERSNPTAGGEGNKEKGIFEYFSQQVMLKPDAIGLVFEGKQISYKELKAQVEKVASVLNQRGINSGDFVCLALPNSIELIIGYLALIKIRCTVIPVDPSLPAERLSYIISDSKAQSIIFSEKEPVPSIQGVPLICIEGALTEEGSSLQTIEVNKFHDLFCLIYTSGTTGLPKGVAISCQSFLNRLFWMYNKYPFYDEDVMCQKTSPSFVDFLWEFLGPLLGGIKSVIFPKNILVDIERFCRDCRRGLISHIVAVPSFVESLLDSGEKLNFRFISVSGEKASQSLLHRLSLQTQSQILNIYGSSEVTADATCYEFNRNVVTPNDAMSYIGAPLDNVDIYVLGTDLAPLPPYSIGELYVGGKGLAFGYWERPDLTAEKFIASPFKKGERLFRTGDLGRFHTDGNLEYIGRKDHQIKLRGIRVEPGEIEFHIKQFHEVKDAVVRLDSGNEKVGGQLVCYFLTDSIVKPSVLTKFLAKRLPSHMIPSIFIEMKQFPTNASRKVDREAFPHLNHVKTEQQQILPRNHLEKALLEIWKEVLNIENIGVRDHFFQLGGHSLLATKVVSRIRKRIQKKVSIKALFDFPTIESLSEYLENFSNTGSAIFHSPTPIKNRPPEVPLSFAQRRLWFLDKFSPEQSTYTMPYAIQFKGGLCRVTLERALNEIVMKHEIFRAVIRENDRGEPYQVIRSKIDFFQFKDLSQLPDTSEEVQTYQVATENHKFDLANGPLFLASLLKISEEEYILLLTIHHIIFDAWSLEILCNEIGHFYEAIKRSSNIALPPFTLQYFDYCIWQNNWMKGTFISSEVDYWKEKLKGIPSSISLPTDFQRPQLLSHKGGYRSFALTKEFSGQVESFCRLESVSLYMFALSTLDILLSKLSGSTDIVVGSPVANRQFEELEGVIGFFVNTIISRSSVLPNKTISELLADIKADLLESYKYQNVPFEQLVDALSVERATNRNPLFQVRLVVHDRIGQEVIIQDVESSFLPNKTIHSKFDLLFRVYYNKKGEMAFQIEYLKDLYLAKTIELFGTYLVAIMHDIVLSPEKQIRDIRLGNAFQPECTLDKAKPSFLPIINHFEKHASLTPDRVFAVCGERQVTFRYLNDSADRLAKELIDQGAEIGGVIGIAVPRSIEHLICVLAVMKAGCTYLPIDPKLPINRQKVMISDCGCSLILGNHLQKDIFSTPFIDIHEFLRLTSVQKQVFKKRKVISLLPAYIIYTSGTTGKPKGVVIDHRALMNYVTSIVDHVAEKRCDCYGYINAAHADLGYTTLFTAIFLGKRLYIEETDKELEVEDVCSNLYQQRVDLLKITPSYYQAIREKIPKDIQLIFGGEPLPPRFLNSDKEITNHYGPTETTIGVLTSLLHEGQVVTIGTPVENVAVYILDKQLEHVGTGIVGEIYISGVCVSQGYVNEPALTAEKFLANPFSKGKVMYKTGDLGRFLVDGKVEFLGRSDQQVKIRGFRVECGEISSILVNHGDIVDAYVTTWKGNRGEEQLVGYCVPGEFEPSILELEDYLKEYLPDYMVPSQFVFVKAIPLTANGKVDLKSLPEPEWNIESDYEAPTDEFESKVCEIWAEVLKLDRVGLSDNFFKVGGHSLLAIQVISRIRAYFGKEVRIAILFENPTVKSLCRAIRELADSTEENIPPLRHLTDHPNHPPLSFSQQRLWFLEQLYPDLTLYNMPVALEIQGELNPDALESAFSQVIRRHQVLHTVFEETDSGELYQKVHSNMDLFCVVDLKGSSDPDSEIEKEKAFEENWHFDLRKGPLMRVKLLIIAIDRHVLLVTLHHIICDGWSIDILFREAWNFYNQLTSGEKKEIPVPSVQYIDYATWQHHCFQEKVFENQLNYWKEKLRGIYDIIPIPTDFLRPKTLTYEGGVEGIEIRGELVTELRKFSVEMGISLHMLFLTTLDILLYKLTGIKDIVVGVPVANRHYKELENTIGFFVNTLVSRVNVLSSQSFRELLIDVKQDTLDSNTHQDIPFEAIVDALSIERATNRNPLFQVMFNYSLRGTGNEESLQGLTVKNIANEYSIAKFDLEVNIYELDDECYSLKIKYLRELFSPITIRKWLSYFTNILSEVVFNPEKCIREVDLFSDGTLLGDAMVSGSSIEFPIESNLCALMRESALEKQDQIAVVSNSTQLTYRELHHKSNQLANFLIEDLDIKVEDRVALCMERNEWMVITILAVLKAGAVFVPLDPDFPAERINYVLNDTLAKCVFTSFSLETSSLSEISIPILSISDLNLDDHPLEIPAIQIRSQNLAYIIYTSGSTGVPKGVAITHRSLINRYNFVCRALEESVFKRMLQKTPYFFDVSVVELLFTILSGGTQVMAPPGAQKDPWEITQLIEKELIETVHFVPSMVKSFLDVSEGRRLSSLSNILLSGEYLSVERILELNKRFPSSKITNLYGPTETTIDSTYFICSNQHVSSIGLPIDNTRVNILDKDLMPTPRGAIGELYIGGEGLARGYFHKPDLTAEKFIADPFSQGKRIYQTGDLVRIKEDGNIDYIGRRDSQVKVRGYRIELGEIERVLESIDKIRGAAVVLQDSEQLIAYYLGEPISEMTIRDSLANSLPSYMIPIKFIPMDSFPLTPSGKLDRKALPTSEIWGGSSGYVPPRDVFEQELVEIWRELLPSKKIGIHDNFFQIGGHSLLATQVISRVRKRFDVEMKLVALFDNPTIAELSTFVSSGGDGLQETHLKFKVPIERPEFPPLSPAQQRLWFLDKLIPDATVYNMSFSFELNGHLNRGAFSKAVQELCQRHESLRTVFRENASEDLYQQVLPSMTLLEEIDLQESCQPEVEMDKVKTREESWHFDLTAGPLARMKLMLLAEDRHVLVLTLHHSICDGWSIDIIFRELGLLYHQYLHGQTPSLLDVRCQYIDYSLYLQEAFQDKVLKSQLEYWKKKLRGIPDSISLPTDYPRPHFLTYQGAHHTFELSSTLSELAKNFCYTSGISLYMLFLAVLDILLSKLSGTSDIVIGSPVANRQYEEIEGTVGLFVNTLISRIQVKGNMSVSDLISEVKSDVLESYNYQDAPFEQLVDALSIERSTNRNPIFQVRLVVNEQGGQGPTFDGIETTFLPSRLEQSKFDLLFRIFSSHNERISIRIEYLLDLFSAQNIQVFESYLTSILEQVVEKPSLCIRDLAIGNGKAFPLSGNTQLITQDSIVDLFEKTVDRYEDTIAVVTEKTQVTFQTINRRANQLARYFLLQGASSGGVIGIAVERGLDFVVGMLATLKVGCSYVPIEPSLPEKRQRHIVKDSGCSFVFVLDFDDHKHDQFSCKIVRFEEEKLPSDTTNLGIAFSYRQPAYIVYTSGTTGEPKGVIIDHRSVVNYINHIQKKVLNDEAECIGFMNVTYADLGYTALFTPLLSGKRLHILPKGLELEVEQASRMMKREQVNVLKLTPSHLRVLQEDLSKDIQIILGGESVPRSLLSCGFDLTNHYGPTEATIGVTTGKLSEDRKVTIGKPISNVSLYILDNHLSPLGIGLVGEIYIGGTSLAHGYVSHPDLTAEKFIASPFSSGERIYKTGDLGRYRADGDIEILGRIDEQVKIRGFRVELTEISSLLQEHGDLIDAYVTSFKTPSGEPQLVAYCVPGDFTPSTPELEDYLSEHMPDYMVPSFYEMLEVLPLLPNGKIDHNALELPKLTEEVASILPRTSLEKRMCEIWQSVLNLDEVGITDNFFKIGGHSLIATQIISRVRSELNFEIKIATLFDHPTVGELCSSIEEKGLATKGSLVTISNKPRSKHPPLSFAQQRLWFLNKLLPDKVLYNMPFAFNLSGTLNCKALKNSIDALIKRHETLRVVIGETQDNKGYQKVLANPEIYEDIDLIGKVFSEEAIEEMIASEGSRRFDLSKGPLLRIKLVRLSDETSLFLMTIHHIICDGWSVDLIYEELAAFYTHFAYGDPLTLPDVAVPYIDYAIWQREYLQGDLLKNQQEYWQKKLSSIEGAVDLPTDYPRQKVLNYEGAYERLDLSESLSGALMRLSQDLEASVYMLMLTSIHILLHKISVGEDISIGSPIANRHFHETEQTVGLFANTLVNTFHIIRSQSFSDAIIELKENLLESYQHQDIPFEYLVDMLSIERSLNKNPLFQVMFNYNSMSRTGGFQLKGLDVSNIANEYSVAKFDLEIASFEMENGRIAIKIKYLKELYKPETIRSYLSTLERILTQGANQPRIRIGEIEACTEEEVTNFELLYNNTLIEFPEESCVHTLFEQQAQETPDSIAVVFESKQLTYRELDELSNQLAHLIVIEHGVLPEDPIAIIMDRSERMLIAILAVFKAGGTYIPIAPEFPSLKIRELLEEITPRLILSDLQEVQDEYQDLPVFLVNLSEIKHSNALKGHLELPSMSEQLAYIIFTSGTTGKGKGVMISHRSVINRLTWMQNAYAIDSSCRLIQKTPYIFDVSVWELLAGLLKGGTLVMSPPGMHKEPFELRDLIFREQVSHLHFVPSMVTSFLETLKATSIKTVKYFFCSGEPLPKEKVHQIQRKFPETIIINLYGPTETTIDSTFSTCRVHQKVFIGYPINNTTAYVLDENMNHSSIGLIGELYIGGVGLSRGYFGKPDQTAASFIASPFDSGERLYRTGDLVRRNNDGGLEYLGRKDLQVKLRGLRIELGEIENSLLGFHAVREAVVVLRKSSTTHQDYLVAYYTSDFSLDVEEIKKHLVERLPEYMVPQVFVKLDAIPITANGKVNRRSLPEPNMVREEVLISPQTPLQKQMCEIWKSVLGLKSIGIQEDFFHLGGDSIISIQIVSRLRNKLGLSVTIRDILEYRTIERLSQVLKELRGCKFQTGEQGILTGPVHLLPIQKWFFQQKFTNPHHWNQAFLIRVPELDIDRLNRAIEKLFQHHDSLRLRYRGMEQYYSDVQSKLTLNQAQNNENLLKQLSEWQSKFNLEKGPLTTFGYITGYEDGSARIFIAGHHLLIDVVSWRIIVDSLRKLYHGEELGEKGSSYRQWVNTIERYSLSADEEAYWQSINTSEPPLPWIDETFTSSFSLGGIETDRLLKDANRLYNTEVNDLLLAALGMSIHEVLDLEELCLTLEGHGREVIDPTVDVSQTVGWFTTLYPVKVRGSSKIGTIIQETKENLRRIPNKGIGYGILFGYDALSRVSFNYLGRFESGGKKEWSIANEWGGETSSPENTRQRRLWFEGSVKDGKLQFQVGGRLQAAVIRKLAESFQQNLEKIVTLSIEQSRSYLTLSDIGGIISQEYLNQLQREKDIEAVYLANSLQQGLIYHTLKQGDIDDSYRVQLVWSYRTKIDSARLENAWKCAMKKFGALRLRFAWFEDLVQIIDKEGEIDWRVYDLSNFKGDQAKELLRIQQNDRKEGYDLSKGRLWRVYLIKHSDDHYSSIFSNHHSILDGWGRSLLLEFVHNTYLSPGEIDLSRILPDMSYEKVQEYLQKHSNESESYWEELLSQVEKKADLTSLLTESSQSNLEKRFIERPVSHRIVIEGGEFAKLRAFCSKHGLTLNSVVQFIWHKVLSVFGGSSVTVAGITISGRDLPLTEAESTVGLCINTLPLVVKHRPHKTIVEAIREVQESIQEVCARSTTHLGTLQKKGETLFDSIVVFENYPGNKGENPLRIEPKYGVEKLDYPLSIISHEVPEGLVIKVNYAEEMFDPERIEGLVEVVKSLFQQASHDPLKVGELSLTDYISDGVEDNSKISSFYQRGTLDSIFEAQANKTPDAIAIVARANHLTYQEVNDRSSKLSQELSTGYHVKHEDVIPILCNRDEWMMISILGTLKSGAAYVPLDPSFPKFRIDHIISEVGAKLAICDKSFLTMVEGIKKKETPCLNSALSNEKKIRACSPHSSNGLAYIIYTSGTTGVPKGVMITHRGVINMISSIRSKLSFTGNERVTHYCNFVFDVSVAEMFLPLLNGATLEILDDDLQKKPVELSKFLENKQISLAYIPPVLLPWLPRNKYPSLSTIIYAGESCTKDTGVYWSQRLSLYNFYGPTEGTVYATGKRVINGDTHLIGHPLSNIETYVLDEGLAPLPEGAIGELYLGGMGIARGYLGKPGLTAEKFIPHPLKRGERLYKTGDLVVRHAGGNLEFMGRSDDQVKIRGYRIETSEIESRILANQEVAQAFVTTLEHDEGGHKDLVSYIVPKSLEKFTNGNLKGEVCHLEGDAGLSLIAKLRKRLKNELPNYMVPLHYVLVNRLPISWSGKVIKKELLELLPSDSLSGKHYIPPRSQFEHTLCEIWANLLRIDRVGIQENFFEIGGDSIKLIGLISECHRHGLTLTIRNVLDHPTIRELSLLKSNTDESEGSLYQLLDKHSLEKNKIELDIIVPITQTARQSNSNTKVFMIHPGGGLGFPYYPLKKYLEYELFAVNNPYFYNPEKFKSVEEIAEKYIESILAVQHFGGFNLVGYSFGGLIAIELAKLLLVRRFEVKTIVLIDTPSQLFDPQRIDSHNEDTYCDDPFLNKIINNNIAHSMKLIKSYNVDDLETRIFFLKPKKSPHSFRGIFTNYSELLLEGKHSTLLTDHIQTTAKRIREIFSGEDV